MPSEKMNGRKKKKEKYPCGVGAKKEMLTGKALKIAKENNKRLFKCVPNVPENNPYKKKEREQPGDHDNKYTGPTDKNGKKSPPPLKKK